MSEAALPARPRPWRLQFSLRLFLLAFTGFAVGFPIWYRWPYKEAIDHPSGATLITTWQRQWGGSRVKHGLERLVADGQIVESTMYRDGVRHGPYESEGVRGQFVDDLREGTWTESFRTSNWHRGKLDGLTEIYLPAEVDASKRPQSGGRIILTKGNSKIELQFADGRLTHLKGKPIASSGNSAASHLFNLEERRVLDDRTRAALDRLTHVDFVEQPLEDAFIFLSDLHSIPFALDPKLGSKFDLPLTGEFRGIDLRSTMLLLTVPQNLGCDYRYGCLWVTTADDCSIWHDSTAIREIKPPSGSALARAWNEPIAIDCNRTPLVAALDSIEEKMAISIDTSRIQAMEHRPPFPARIGPSAGYTPTAILHGRALRDVIGHLLYNNGCRCKLEGETLVILPPDESQEQGKATGSVPATSASSLP